MVFATTGLVWGFEWFRDGLHSAVGGNKSLEYVEPPSDAAAVAFKAGMHPVDYLWEKTKAENPDAGSIEMHFPETEHSSIHVAVNPDPSTYWQIDYIYYDRYSLEELSADHIYSRFNNANAADKLIRMNYDIHTVGVIGLPGKILAFFASLIVASLPITGGFLWWGRRKKRKPRQKRVEKNSNGIRRKPVEGITSNRKYKQEV